MTGSIPRYSVIIPVFNKEDSICRSIESVRAQSFQDFEILVVDDGSTDRSAEVVRENFGDSVHLLQQRNQGVSVARNTGIHNARADVVAFLDADDEWESSFLQTIEQLRRSFPSCSVWSTSHWRVDGDGAVTKPVLPFVTSEEWQGILPEFSELLCHTDPPINSSTVAVSKEALLGIGGFPINIHAGEDLLTWLRLSFLAPIAFSAKPATYFHVPGWKERKIRTPRQLDPLRNEVIKLIGMTNDQQKKALGRFLGWWHKTRALTYLFHGNRLDAWRQIRQSARISGWSSRLIAYSCCALLPRPIFLVFYSFFDNIRRRTIN